jgi:hypothetical protein
VGSVYLAITSVTSKAQQILGKFDTDEPFDVISVDIRIPGDATRMPQHQLKKIKKYKKAKQASLTGVCSFCNERLFEFTGE